MQPCYCVDVKRLPGDPVTEPILHEDIICYFIGEEPPNRELLKGKYLDRGRWVTLKTPLLSGDPNKFPAWHLTIEGVAWPDQPRTKGR